MAGNLDAEKNTPDKIHIGSITRFISPDAASMVRARDATSRPSAENDNEVSTQRTANSASDPRKGTPNTSRANPRNATTSIASITRRDSRNEARYCHRGMGDATSRLSSFFWRASTIAKPRPHRSEEHTSELQSLRHLV